MCYICRIRYDINIIISKTPAKCDPQPCCEISNYDSNACQAWVKRILILVLTQNTWYISQKVKLKSSFLPKTPLNNHNNPMDYFRKAKVDVVTVVDGCAKYSLNFDLVLGVGRMNHTG